MSAATTTHWILPFGNELYSMELFGLDLEPDGDGGQEISLCKI